MTIGVAVAALVLMLLLRKVMAGSALASLIVVVIYVACLAIVGGLLYYVYVEGGLGTAIFFGSIGLAWIAVLAFVRWLLKD